MSRNDQDGAAITRGHCPDCDHRGFILGPRGGSAINIECGNPECRARFNVTTFSGVVIHSERIPRESDGGTHWGFGADADSFRGTRPPIGWWP